MSGWLALMLCLIAALPAAAACPDEATSRAIRSMALAAVDASFKEHVETLFSVWMKEHTPGHAARVEAGMDKAIAAYVRSREAIERWECK
jgi:hypothetical protein